MFVFLNVFFIIDSSFKNLISAGSGKRGIAEGNLWVGVR